MDEQNQTPESEPEHAAETPIVPTLIVSTPKYTYTGERYSRRDLPTLALRLADEMPQATVPVLGGAFALMGQPDADLAEIRDAVALFLTLPA